MLELIDWTIGYKEKTVLHKISQRFQFGEIHGILGQNGAGKSTLFNSLYGMLRPASGECLYQTKPLVHNDIAYLQTHTNFYPFMKGKEYLDLIAQNEPNFDSQHWNQLFQLPLHQYISQYSTGMKKKLAFLGILAQNRPIIILDEPFNGVDIESNEKIIQVLKHWQKQGRTLLLSSHILSTLTLSCTHISYLKDGQLVQTYTPEEYPNLERLVQSWAQGDVARVLEQDQMRKN